jgi:hypothetical protein
LSAPETPAHEEVMDASGRRLAKARLPEGMTRLHAMIGQAFGDDIEDDAADVAVRVKIGIETDRGPGCGCWSPRGTRCTR